MSGGAGGPGSNPGSKNPYIPELFGGDPSVSPGLPRPVGWRVRLPDGTAAWDKVGTGDTDWEPVGEGGGEGIDRITSSDGSIAVGNPTGPTTDLTNPTFVGIDVTGMAGVGSGTLAWMYAPGFVLPTNGTEPRACRAIAGFTGGKLIGGGQVMPDAQFTTDGGKPANGAQVYIAESAADGFTGRGKFTATRPKLNILPIYVAGIPLTPAQPTAAGVCIDNSGYPTCKVLLQLPTSPVVADLPPDQFYNAIQLQKQGNANTDPLFGAANSTQFELGLSTTFIMLFSMENAANITGQNDLISWTEAADTGQHGWVLYSGSGGLMSLQYLVGGVPQQGFQFSLANGKPRYGMNCVVWTIGSDGSINACLSGVDFYKSGAAAVPFPATAAGQTLRIGGGFGGGWVGWNCGGIYGFGALARAASQDELVRWANKANEVPLPEIGTDNRYVLPSSFINDPALLWYWNGANQLTTVAGPQGSALPLTSDGTGIFASAVVRALYSFGESILDTSPIVYTAKNYPRTSPGARIAFTVATREDLANLSVAITSNDQDNGDNGGPGFFVNGAFLFSLAPLDAEAVTPGLTIADNNIHWINVRDAGSGGFEAFLDNNAPPYNVEIVIPDVAFHPGTDVLTNGATVAGLQMPLLTFETAATARRLLLIGDTAAIGHDAGTGACPFAASFTTALRADYPGRVTCHSLTTGAIGAAFQWGAGSMLPYARYSAEVAQEGSPATLDVWVQLGWEDYFRPFETVAQFQIQYGQFVDAIHALLPSATIYAGHAIQAAFDATPNTGGETLSQFNAAITAVAATRSWLVDANARLPTAITFTAGNIEPLQPAGALAWKNNAKAIIGY